MTWRSFNQAEPTDSAPILNQGLLLSRAVYNATLLFSLRVVLTPAFGHTCICHQTSRLTIFPTHSSLEQHVLQHQHQIHQKAVEMLFPSPCLSTMFS